MSGLPTKLTIELGKWHWIGIGLASPFVLMTAIKVSWEALHWWATAMFAHEDAQMAVSIMIVVFIWIIGPVWTVMFLIEGVVKLKVKPTTPAAARPEGQL